MIRHVTSLICSKVIADERTKLPSFIEVLSGASFGLTGLPSKIPPLILTSTWFYNSKNKRNIRFRIGIIVPGTEKKEILLEQPIVIGGPVGRTANINVEIANLVAEHEGEYLITVETKRNTRWKLDSEIPFLVDLIKEPKSNAPSPG
ncbi:hypothetical protein UWK_02234 [Desulfocapsa sulfexigens DSM 10523]|uniref:Uncharacterized protein n=1 Tax=Desulfocapsa sulfexigens (strain DSM 10523 / SB164P1) TaxID=1167006 RepID=M1PGK1_DESSD|nr:hypothetical protein [Desulfocapsa sulfexigens]AGF78775.1 hypothetical protein UWK_02234 [Desulfocapsa sulfexigens DSM 10523]